MNIRHKAQVFFTLGAMMTVCACAPVTNKAPSSPTVDAADKREITHRMVEINGIKMRLTDTPLKSGDKVFDTEVGQQALVRSSIVVVREQGPVLDSASLPFENSVKRLVGDTYEIRVLEHQADMYALYQQLKQDPRFSQVELQLQYLSGGEPAEY